MHRRLVLLCGSLLSACATAPQVVATAATVFTVEPGGAIVTLDPTAPRVEAIVVANGAITEAGTREEVVARHPTATVHSLGPRTVLPGIIDAHVHSRELGSDALLVDVGDCPDVACMVTRLRERYPQPESGQWLVADGWDEGAWASRGYPDRAALDEAFAGNPVLVTSRHGFASLANGAALGLAGIGMETADPEGGTIVRDSDGRVTGVLLTLAQDLVRAVKPPLSHAERKAAIVAGLGQLAEAGVTCVHEAGMSRADTAAFVELAQEGALPIRVYGLLDGNDRELVDEWIGSGPRIDPRDHFTVRGFKVFYDGSLGSRTALLAEPYADVPDAARPTERIRPDAVAALAEVAAQSGFQLAVHTIGDEANTRMLDLFEQTFAAVPGDHRWRLEHFQVVAPGGFRRVADLGVIASMQPSHAVGDSAWAEDRVGPDRIRRAYAWRSVLEAGAPLVLDSDVPGEPWMPMQTLYFAVTRQPLDGSVPPWQPEQALTIDEAIEAMTVTAAYAGFHEGRLGQLRPGAWADFIVLDADPWRTEAARLAEITVEQTWIAGAPLPAGVAG
ncbi:MAG: amidohydrolase [Myxococcota bacterium]